MLILTRNLKQEELANAGLVEALELFKVLIDRLLDDLGRVLAIVRCSQIVEAHPDSHGRAVAIPLGIVRLLTHGVLEALDLFGEALHVGLAADDDALVDGCAARGEVPRQGVMVLVLLLENVADPVLASGRGLARHGGVA